MLTDFFIRNAVAFTFLVVLSFFFGLSTLALTNKVIAASQVISDHAPRTYININFINDFTIVGFFAFDIIKIKMLLLLETCNFC